MRLPAKALLATALFGIVGSTTAQYAKTDVEHTQTVHTEEALAKSWNLSIKEWKRYEALMKGPRGTWTPNLDPITVLGINAQTDAERKRYAELLVTVEFERVRKELLFQRAYDEAAKKLFPQLPRVRVASAEKPLSLIPGADRVAFLGSIDPNRCPTCRRELARLLQSRHGLNPAPVDIFVADAPTDNAIRAWAKAEGISPKDVRSGQITLNHARGQLAPPTTDGPITPRVLQRLAGQWLPMSSQ